MSTSCSSSGRIAAVVAAGRARADRVIDAGGGALIPGLHDHHVHLLASRRGAVVDVVRATGGDRIGEPSLTRCAPPIAACRAGAVAAWRRVPRVGRRRTRPIHARRHRPVPSVPRAASLRARLDPQQRGARRSRDRGGRQPACRCRDRRVGCADRPDLRARRVAAGPRAAGRAGPDGGRRAIGELRDHRGHRCHAGGRPPRTSSRSPPPCAADSCASTSSSPAARRCRRTPSPDWNEDRRRSSSPTTGFPASTR